MEQVEIRDGSRSAVFRSPIPFTGDRLWVALEADGLRAEHDVYVFGQDVNGLAAFFQDLADSWRGWGDVKVWNSIEHDLRIEARSDAGRHCLLNVVVRDGPIPTLNARVDDISVDAGEDLASLARSFAAWTQR